METFAILETRTGEFVELVIRNFFVNNSFAILSQSTRIELVADFLMLKKLLKSIQTNRLMTNNDH